MALNLDEFLQHELYINRLASGGINSYVYPSLVDTYKAIRQLLQAEESITTKAQLNRVLVAINKAIEDNGGWLTMTNESLLPLATYEAQWQAQFIGAAIASKLSTPAEKKIASYVNNALMSLESGKRVNAGTWSEFYHANLDSRKRAINGIVKTGYSRGATINEMSRDIRTTFDGVLKREAEALARTGYQHYAAAANEAMINDNKDVLDEYFYVIVFDSRTSNICQSISTMNEKSRRFSVNDLKAPRPPLHFNAVAEGERVLTKNGNKPIEEVAVGDEVLTHKGRFKKVLTVMRKSNDSSVIRVIRFKSGREIRVTDEHPVLLDGAGWVRADEIKVGDHLFEYYGEKSPITNRSPVVEANPYDYPSLFDSEEVFTKVAFESGSVASSIDLDNDLVLDIDKIPNGISNNILMDKKGIAKELLERFFAKNFCFPVNISHSCQDLCFSLGVMDRVVASHPFRMPSMNFGGFLGHTISPMVRANTQTIRHLNFCSLSSSLGLTKRFNVMHSAPSTHSSVSKIKFALDSAKCFSSNVVVFFKKRVKEIFVGKIATFKHNWNTSIVSDISIVEYNKDVYNLEVEDDNTYLIDNIVVHNCRTRRIAVPKGLDPVGTRAALGAKESGEEAFNERKSRLRTKSQVRYRGKKDKNIFTPEQIAANTPLDKWLREQPDYYIKDTLGAKRFKLFKEGGLTLKQFSDINGNPLSLDEIIKRHPIIARRVGVE